MSQYKTGTASVTSGSATVTGSGTAWLSNVSAGDAFTIVGSGVTYTVASVASDTSLTLSANYAGSTASGQSYAITRDFTTDGIPELSQGDIETATIFTRAVRKIQDLITAGKTLFQTAKIQMNPANGSGDITMSTSASRMLLGGGTNTGDGAAIVVRGNTNATNPGGIEMFAQGAEKLRMTLTGNFGIGSSMPNDATRFVVAGGSLPSGDNGNSNAIQMSGGVIGRRASANIVAFVGTYANSSSIEISAGQTGSGISIHGQAASSNPNSVLIYAGNSERVRVDSTGMMRPGVDNAQSVGSASYRWSVVYAGTGTINTSDAREKTAVSDLTSNELAAAKDLAKEIGTYKFLASIAEKGELSARNHIGMTVQRAIEIMELHGLNPFEYGFICFDEWGELTQEIPAVIEQQETGEVDEDGNPIMEDVEVEPARTEIVREAGDRYSFRPDELLMFIARGFEARLSALEAQASP